MCSPTVERSNITVKSAGVHSAERNIWKPTSAFTLKKNHTSAYDAVTQVLNPLISNDAWPNIKQLTNFFMASRTAENPSPHSHWRKTIQAPTMQLLKSGTLKRHMTKHPEAAAYSFFSDENEDQTYFNNSFIERKGHLNRRRPHRCK